MHRLVRPIWLLGHFAMVALVVTFLALGWWQIGRASHGNALSFGYSLEWPFFAAFVVFIWQREVRAVLRAERAPEHDDESAPEPKDNEPTPAGVTRFDVSAAMAQRVARDRAAHIPPQGETHD